MMMRFCLLLFLFSSQLFIDPRAFADDMRPASLSIEQQNNDQFLVTWKVPAKNNQRLALNVSFDGETEQLSQPRSDFVRGAVLQQWSIQRAQGLQGFSVHIDGLVTNSADVLLRIIDAENQLITSVLNVDKPFFIVEGESQARTSNTMLTYIILGIEHILIGFDHLLFVACLVYLCNSLRKLLWTITGFTVAHSITLMLAATGLVSIAIPPVEAVIALSIVFLAMEIAKQREHSLALRYPVLVSSSFGLLHGFGFASVLADIGVPDGEKITALLSFNIGVEIGQLLFVAGLYIGFYLLKLLWRDLSVEKLRWVVSYSCGSLALYWFLQRLAAF